MSKIIRTAQIKGPSVIVGEIERDVYVESLGNSSEDGVDSLGLESLFAEQSLKIKRDSDDSWQNKLDKEIKAVRTGLEARQTEIEAKWKREREDLHANRYNEGLNEGLAQREAEAKAAIDRFSDLRESLISERRELLIKSELETMGWDPLVAT